MLKTEIGNKNKIYRVLWDLNSTRTIWRAEPSPMTCLFCFSFLSVFVFYICLTYTYM